MWDTHLELVYGCQVVVYSGEEDEHYQEERQDGKDPGDNQENRHPPG